MIINHQNLQALFVGFRAVFSQGAEKAPSHYKAIATIVNSGTAENIYGWLGQFPELREWIGHRVIKNITAHKYSIANKTYENTISIPRTSIEDDTHGFYGPVMEEMGRSAAEHPDKLIFGLLASGFSELCYDGRPFFDASHPLGATVGAQSVSNMQAGDGPAWFLLDTSRAVKPLVFQERLPFKLVEYTKETDERVFFHDEYIYGVRARANVGFGFWQLAFASKAPLTAENYEAARSAMMSQVGDEGRPLGVRPDVLVVPSALEGAAMRLLNNGQRLVTIGDPENGGTTIAVTNEWAGTAKPIVTPWLFAS